MTDMLEKLARAMCHDTDGGRGCGCGGPDKCWNWEPCVPPVLSVLRVLREPDEEICFAAMKEWDSRHKAGERSWPKMMGHCFTAMIDAIVPNEGESK